LFLLITKIKLCSALLNQFSSDYYIIISNQIFAILSVAMM
jgi:hypothetical protein